MVDVGRRTGRWLLQFTSINSAVVLSRPHMKYESCLFTVCLPGEEEFHERLDGRVPYVELATL